MTEIDVKDAVDFCLMEKNNIFQTAITYLTIIYIHMYESPSELLQLFWTIQPLNFWPDCEYSIF